MLGAKKLISYMSVNYAMRMGCHSCVCMESCVLLHVCTVMSGLTSVYASSVYQDIWGLAKVLSSIKRIFPVFFMIINQHNPPMQQLVLL